VNMSRPVVIIALVLCLVPFMNLAAADAASPAALPSGFRVFNVKDFGATGLKAGNPQAAIQKAIDACAASGGGIVYLPPGDYTTGTLHLRSHVRFFVEAGATVYSIKQKAAFDKDSLLYGEDLVNVTIEGRGVFDGEARYDWRLSGDFQDDFIRSNQIEQAEAGKPLLRSFPKTDQFGHLLLLVRCKDVRISGVSFVDSPSWTMHLVHCERMVIDGINVRTSLKDGVWADGIDPDCCRDLRISNCTIETGDDALVFYSMDWFGPATPCENITITNCRLSSSSSAIKFCDGNIAGIRNVTIDNCVITSSNRGVAFMTFDGGPVENIVLSNLTIETARNDWFWWGDGEPFHFNIRKRSEVHANWPKEKDRPAGAIRNVKIQNVIAHGYGMSVCNGHPDSWLDGVTFENVKLFIAHDPRVPYDKAVDAIRFELARNLRLRDFEVVWEAPLYDRWRSALAFENIMGLVLDGVTARQAHDGGSAPAILFRNVDDAFVRDCRAAVGTATFLLLSGPGNRSVVLSGNDLRRARTAWALADGASQRSIEIRN
jgi:polygalacturonase